jgi:N-acyl homoserine lactone hydrolase
VLFRWDILVPAQRYVFSLEEGRLVEHDRPGDSSADRFRRYQELKAAHPVHGMIAWPNSVLLTGPRTIIVDPGILAQGPPLLLALAARGLSPEDVDLVVNTHLHADHSQANLLFPDATLAVHEREWAENRAGPTGGSVLPSVRLLEGDSGEICPGLTYLLTPGHSEGSICLVGETAEGRVVLAGDTVGPLPEYFDMMDLPPDFPARQRLLAAWRLLRGLGAQILVPGHNPPVRL